MLTNQAFLGLVHLIRKKKISSSVLEVEHEPRIALAAMRGCANDSPGVMARHDTGSAGARVGGSRVRRWTPTQQPPDYSSSLQRKAAGGFPQKRAEKVKTRYSPIGSTLCLPLRSYFC
jgi:hypothetical protein